MNIPKIVANRRHQIWCENFLREQNKSTKLIRRMIKKTKAYNPLSDNTVDNMLKRYEKSFWAGVNINSK